MESVSKIAILVLTGALISGALTGCSYETTRDTVVGDCTNIQDSVVDGWNNMVDGFVADAPNYGVETPERD